MVMDHKMYNMLENKTIVISGGTKGVGRGIAIEAAKQGANVVLGGRDQMAGNEVIQEVKATGQTGEFVFTELHDIKQCKRLFDVAIERFGRADGFVNYAGITPVASLCECEEQT